SRRHSTTSTAPPTRSTCPSAAVRTSGLRLPLCSLAAAWCFLVSVHLGRPENPEAHPGRRNLCDDLPHGIRRRHARPRGHGRLPPSCPGSALRHRGHPSVMAVTGCTSQIVGIRLFKLGGPGCCPIAWFMSKNSDPAIVTGIGGS